MLTIRKAGGTHLEYLKIKMEQVIVSHISNGGGAGQDRVTENVTLNFLKFTQIYTPQDAKGTAKPSFNFTWDIAAASE
jgi:type VI secretion system secreted protein Hcp